MEMLVATWSVRLTLIGTLLVAGISIAAGVPLLDVALRVGVTAFVLTFAARQLMGFLETPEQKRRRLLARHAGKAPKAPKGKKGGEA